MRWRRLRTSPGPIVRTLAHRVREAIARVLGPQTARGTRQVYDVAHNVAKLEQHGGRELCVHRKGVTRAFPPGSPDIPAASREVGQPVFIAGSMGTSSPVLVGEPAAMELSFGTTCHGAGRRISRAGARRQITGTELRRQLKSQGIVVRCPSNKGLAKKRRSPTRTSSASPTSSSAPDSRGALDQRSNGRQGVQVAIWSAPCSVAAAIRVRPVGEPAAVQ